MKLRSNAIDKSEDALRGLEERRADLSAELEQAEAESAAAQAKGRELHEIEGLLTLGELDAKSAERRRAEIKGAIEQAERQRRGLAAAIAELERRIAKARSDLRSEQRQAQRKRAQTVHDECDRHADKTRAALEHAAALVDELRRLRSRAREARDAFAELADGETFDNDEAEAIPNRQAIEMLLEFLQAEAEVRRREAGDRAATAQSRREQAWRERRELIVKYAWTGDSAIFDELDEQGAAEARRQHGIIRRAAQLEIEKIVSRVHEGAFSPRRALNELQRLPQVPADLRAETEAKLEQMMAAAA